jgi:uncharacterized protein YPO0396
MTVTSQVSQAALGGEPDRWVAESMQVVNWGGYNGHVTIAFDEISTLFSGGSGTGKSTLLDAYLALMMKSTIRFNGASNESTGRARSEGQRTLLTYLRGMQDETDDGSGGQVAFNLRGNATDTWGAISVTFRNHAGRRYSVAKAYYVKAEVTSATGILTRQITFDGHLDLSLLEPFAAGLFQPKDLKVHFTGLATHESGTGFMTAFCTRLGIGERGDGTRALDLLAKLQAGTTFVTVDDLYRRLVLDVPATFDTADGALKSFDELEQIYLAMTTEQHKAELLSPIGPAYGRLTKARDKVALLTSVGLTGATYTPLGLWGLRREQGLLETEAEENRTARSANRERLKVARAAATSVGDQLTDTRRSHELAGGADLIALSGRQEHLEGELENRTRQRASLTEKSAVLGATFSTRAEYDAAAAIAREFLEGATALRAAAIEDRADLVRAQAQPMERRRQIRIEVESLRGRAGRIPHLLDAQRREAAAALGVDPDELPFLAELLDVAPEHAQWRTAIEVVLSGSARTILVAQDRFEQMSIAVNRLSWSRRVDFRGAALNVPFSAAIDTDRVAGKLLFKDGPFSGWVQELLHERSLNALCVSEAADLAGGGYRVSLTGQERRDGRRGRHGRSDQPNVIGFSNVDTLAELEAEDELLKEELDGLAAAIATHDRETSLFDLVRSAHERICDVEWLQIDVAWVETEIAKVGARRAQILAANDELLVLEELIEELKDEHEKAIKDVGKYETERDVLAGAQVTLIDRQDKVNRLIDEMEHGQQVLLSPTQATWLDEQFASTSALALTKAAEHDAAMRTFLRHLAGVMNVEGEESRRSESDLTQVFGNYQSRWEDQNLGVAVESYPDYAAILLRIEQTGLHERREAFRSRLMLWSGQDLVPLNGRMTTSLNEIRNRLVPINDILATLPFGAGRDRLQIKFRLLQPDGLAEFRSKLKNLAGTTATGLDDAQMASRFRELQQFMELIRPSTKDRPAPMSRREEFLDVRRHLEIKAERVSQEGQLLSTYHFLQGKSGGESQEMIAFIVGAALRFRLGGEDSALPRFAPVILDEGFVKSDGEFAGRAVDAWTALGFQLIIATPLDKVNGLERQMHRIYLVTKDEQTKFPSLATFSDDDGSARA